MDIVHDPITAGLVRALPAGKTIVEKRQLFTSSGTWTRPAAMVGNPIITMIGGGASGNKGSGTYLGGDGGQYVIDLLVDIGSDTSAVVTIGAGGASSATTSRSAGSVSSFGAYVSLLGGAAGSVYTGASAAGAIGGVNATIKSQNTPLGLGGDGGNFGGGGGGLQLDASGTKGFAPEGAPAKGYGSGGGSSFNSNGGVGASGACLVKWMQTI
jgi:hypothetical protein